MDSAEGDRRPSADDYNQSSRSKGKFRFKSRTRESKHRSSRDRDHRRDHERPHSRHHRKDREHDHDGSPPPSKRRHRHHHRPRQPSPHTIPNPHASPLSPTDAFRESLFDAMVDDEGAAYWESVYGQPIHTYDIPAVPKGPDGSLEQMSEEEYVAYVRARMWERTREGIAEEQERIRAERRRAKAAEDDAQRRDHDRRAFDAAMMDSLARGAERRRMKAWDGVWAKYVASWEEIGRVFAPKDAASAGDAEASAERESASLRNLLFWPVLSGKRRDVSPDAVREFLGRAPPSTDLLATLKIERVRWHPDKMQHRYGAQGIEDAVMRSVTEVFQIVDRMWNEERERKR